jgi:hypothetical protein
MQWSVIYQDGSIHTQEELESHSKIEFQKLRQFRLTKNGKILITVFFDGEKKPIFRIRHICRGMTIDPDKQELIYLVGWKPKKGEPTIFYIYEDGRIEADGARNNLELLPCEQWE